MKREFNMKTVLYILAVVSMLVASYEIIKGRIDGAILFTVWSFYLKYLSDKRE
jgi:hypothetical protein